MGESVAVLARNGSAHFPIGLVIPMRNPDTDSPPISALVFVHPRLKYLLLTSRYSTTARRTYTPVPGTPLYQEMQDQHRMLGGVDLADIHGQDKFNFQHAAISREQSKQFLDWAFRREFERSGGKLFRVWRTTL